MCGKSAHCERNVVTNSVAPGLAMPMRGKSAHCERKVVANSVAPGLAMPMRGKFAHCERKVVANSVAPGLAMPMRGKSPTCRRRPTLVGRSPTCSCGHRPLILSGPDSASQRLAAHPHGRAITNGSPKFNESDLLLSPRKREAKSLSSQKL